MSVAKSNGVKSIPKGRPIHDWSRNSKEYFLTTHHVFFIIIIIIVVEYFEGKRRKIVVANVKINFELSNLGNSILKDNPSTNFFPQCSWSPLGPNLINTGFVVHFFVRTN